MKKKIVSLFLTACFLLSPSSLTSAASDDDSQSTVMAHNGNPFHGVSNGDENSEIVMEDAQTIVSSDCVYTDTADSEYLEWLFGTPDEIISASTGELLEYFLKSPFMGQQVYSCSSTFHDNEIDFSCHEAFRELVSREDFIKALESYAGKVLYSSGSNELDRIEFEKLLAQPFVKSLISDSEYTATADNYPNLRSMYTASEVVS